MLIKSFNTPILFLVFNRPKTTSQVFDVIRSVKPARLYIAGDGPRESINDDIQRIELDRKICSNVD